jgi:hypothetical protein
MIDRDVISGSACLGSLPREIQVFCQALAMRHGGGRLASGSSGTRLYLPCPACLNEKGEREFHSKHLSIDIDRYFGRSSYKGRKRNPEWSAFCHRSDSHRFGISELQKMQPVEERGLRPVFKRLTITYGSDDTFIDDGKGHKIPRPPGKTVSILRLPQTHPAVEYLLNRGYDIESLYRQFRTSYCYEEWPESEGDSEGKGKWKYSVMPDGWKDTPQGRIVFFCDVHEVQVGWQARIIDREEDSRRLHFHPYRASFVVTATRDNSGVWNGVYPYNAAYPKWNPSKYRTARGSHRNEILAGFDAAVAFNAGRERKTIFLVEGPLDAGRIGPPACAVMGKHLGEGQANLLHNFQRIVLVPDNDVAGETLVVRTRQILGARHVPIEVCRIPKDYKDIGEMSTAEARALVAPFLQ